MKFNISKLTLVVGACLGLAANVQATNEAAQTDQTYFDQQSDFNGSPLKTGWGWDTQNTGEGNPADCDTEFETVVPDDCNILDNPGGGGNDPDPLPIEDPILGFAELHSHLMAEHSFDGKWFSGHAEGTKHGVKRCSGNLPKIKLLGVTIKDFGPKHANVDFPLDIVDLVLPIPDIIDPLFDQYASERVGVYRQTSPSDTKGKLLTVGDTGLHLGKRRGWDERQCKKFLWWNIPGTCPKTSFEDWPSWDSRAHQQMWLGWMKDAHQNGMNVLVVSATESKMLCHRMPGNNTNYSGCNEMNSAIRQIEALNAYVGRNSSWVEIATSPAHAREIIQTKRKLAIIAAVEITDLFPQGNGTWQSQLDTLYDLGVRSIQVAHHANNRFAGTAPIPKLVEMAKWIDKLVYPFNDFTEIDEPTCGTDCDGITKLNNYGLTTEGIALVREMMRRGMLVDVAHSSRKTIEDVYNLSMAHTPQDTTATGPYPMFYSHAHFLPTAGNADINEKYITTQEAGWIAQTSGMVGLRTGPEKTLTYAPSGVANNCDGSSRSFAQSLAWGVDQNLKIGFGADLNGFIHQMLPRNGHRIRGHLAKKDGHESCGGNDSQHAAQASTLVADEYVNKGLAHIGLLDNLIDDLKRVGLNDKYLNAINSSAEAFVQTWELAEKNK